MLMDSNAELSLLESTAPSPLSALHYSCVRSALYGGLYRQEAIGPSIGDSSRLYTCSSCSISSRAYSDDGKDPRGSAEASTARNLDQVILSNADSVWSPS
jgi:hypothetical protein